MKRSVFIALMMFGVHLLVVSGLNSQSLKWVDGYKPYVDVGLSLRPVCNSNVVFTYVGGMVGLSIRNPEKRLGINLRLEYYIPFVINNDSLRKSLYNHINAYVELTYRIAYISNKPLMFGLGIAKPSYANSPNIYCPVNCYINCPVNCYINNLSISLHQTISAFNFEVRMYTPLGTWQTSLSTHFFKQLFFSFGVNYNFPLSKNKEKT